MHLKVTKKKTKKGIGEYAKIVEGYWDKKSGFSRQRIILNLGPIRSEKDKIKFNQILESMRKDKEFVQVDEISAKNTKEFGVTYTTTKLFEKYDIDTILQKHLSVNHAQFNICDILKALIVNRLVKPSSDLSACDWIKKHYHEDMCLQNQHIYRTLDYLIQRKEGIEEDLFMALKAKLKLSTDAVHYDLTSSYVEGNSCNIAMFGYSRDHRKDRKQIVLGLAMCDGVPIMHDVYEGNTPDKATLKDMQENLKNRFRIRNTTIVADAGLLTENNVEMLENEEFQYILSMYRRNNNLSKQLLVHNIQSEKQQCAKEVHTEKVNRNRKQFMRRYILCLNKDTRKQRLDTLERIKNDIENKLRELQEQYRKSQETKGKKIKRDDCMLKANNILGKNKRLFILGFKHGLVYSLNQKNWEYEKNIAGKFLLVTNTDKEPEEAMKIYKELQMVENAFDEIKNFLDVRPIHHNKERRVKAHVFVCVLAFLTECIIERFSSQTARRIINELETVRVVNLNIGEKKKKLIIELSEDVQNIFKDLSIAQPIIYNL